MNNEQCFRFHAEPSVCIFHHPVIIIPLIYDPSTFKKQLRHINTVGDFKDEGDSWKLKKK
jgi:hypothetical protein